jgi:hypothetical protein
MDPMTLMSKDLELLIEMAQVNLKFVFPVLNVKGFGAWGDGVHDDTDAIQEAVEFAKRAGGGIIALPVGSYLVSSPIQLNADPLALVDNIAFVGIDGVPTYNSHIMPSMIIASSSFPASSPILDMRYTVRTTVRNIGILGKGGSSGTYGIEYGERTSSGRSYSHHIVNNCSIHQNAYGIKASNSGLFRIDRNNISGNHYAGIGFLQFCGDSDLDGNFINTNNVDYAADDLFTGCGIILNQASSNVNIRGGKIEWNAKGILIYGSNGTVISGVNFDVNKWAQIIISADNSAEFSAMGFSITGNRFMGGGTYATSGGIGKSHVYVRAGGSGTAQGAITGNTFRKSGTLAFDNNTSGAVGPALYGVAAQGDGKIRLAIAGNEMIDCSALNTFNGYGANVKLYAAGNATNLPNYIDGGATLTTG